MAVLDNQLEAQKSAIFGNLADHLGPPAPGVQESGKVRTLAVVYVPYGAKLIWLEVSVRHFELESLLAVPPCWLAPLHCRWRRLRALRVV